MELCRYPAANILGESSEHSHLMQLRPIANSMNYSSCKDNGKFIMSPVLFATSCSCN